MTIWTLIGMAVGAIGAAAYVGAAWLKTRHVRQGLAAKGWGVLALGVLVAGCALYGATVLGGEPATFGYLLGALVVAAGALAFGHGHHSGERRREREPGS